MTSTQRDRRTPEQLREHYEVEKSLADQLRSASQDERLALYPSLYDELYRRVPHHPQLTRKKTPELQRESIDNQMKLLRKLLAKDKSFLEVGAATAH